MTRAARTLVVTNDFPTRRGGIETFVYELAQRLAGPGDASGDPGVVVHTARMPGAAEFDAALPFPVVRDPRAMLVPTPDVRRRVAQTFLRFGCDRVLFGASAPLGLLAGPLRQAGARRVVALTHGHETWWARVPGTRRLLAQIGDGCDVLTYVSEWCRRQIAPALSVAAADRMRRLSPGVDVHRFRPGCGGADVRARLGIAESAPVLVCTARLVRRKGHDVLLTAWRRVLSELPQARLLLVGDGPDRRRIERAVARLGITDGVILTGGVDWGRMPAYVDAGDVFAMPSRTRLFGLEPEALGIVFLEAAACGLPVLVGDSGGASETVRPGSTGWVVDPRDPDALAGRMAELLRDPALATRMGTAGREWVSTEWTWDVAAATLSELLHL